MRKKILLSVPVAPGGPAPHASAQLLTAFSFNDGQTSGSTATAATLASSHGQTSAITTSFVTGNVQVVTGSAVNEVSGDTAGNALNLQGGTTEANNGATIQFTLSTTNFTNLVLSLSDKRSNTGFNSQTFAYNTGSGFTTFAVDSSISTTFSLLALSLPTAAENQATLTIQITFAGATGATGTNSLDNLGIDSVPEPSTCAAMAFGGLGAVAMLRYRRRRA